MANTAISQGLARQTERPDIHKKVPKLSTIQRGYPPSVAIMIQDLKRSVPELSIRQLSTLVCVSIKTVQNALSNPNSENLSRDLAWGYAPFEQETWTAQDNPASTAAELAALHEHHPGRWYEDAPEAANERTGPVLFTAPDFHDTHKRADQSHTIKRPITLATTPFDWAA